MATRNLALLKLDRKIRGRSAILNNDIQGVATRAYVIGAPKGYGFSITDGLISQLRRVDGFPQYQVSCPISPGNSGGPLLDERGRVIGIVSWTKTDAQNMSFVIPTREIFSLDATRSVLPWQDLSAEARPPLAPASRGLRTAGQHGKQDEFFSRSL
jgi:S1-C subfamily serine protease